MDLHARKGHAMTRVDVAGMRVGYYEPVDRHGLRPRDDKVGVGAWLLSLRGESGARDAAIHRVSEDANGNCGLFTSPPFTFHPSIFTLPLIGPQ